MALRPHHTGSLDWLTRLRPRQNSLLQGISALTAECVSVKLESARKGGMCDREWVNRRANCQEGVLIGDKSRLPLKESKERTRTRHPLGPHDHLDAAVLLVTEGFVGIGAVAQFEPVRNDS